MNITQIDLLDLKHKVENRITLSENERSVLYHIFLSFISEVPTSCDVIMVLGNPTCVDTRLPKAIDIWNKNMNASIVLCGGIHIPGKNITEAEAMKNFCINAGVDRGKIFLENNSATTKENIEFAVPIVKDLHIEETDIAVVSSFSHLRRVMMNFDQYKESFPANTRVLPIASNKPKVDIDYYLWDDSLINEVAMELGYIHEYIYVLGYDAFSI